MVFGILGMLMQLAVFGAIAWAIVRLLGRHRGGDEVEVDRATSVRRLVVYGLMLVTLILAAVGATLVGRTALTSDWSDDERTTFALGLAFALVAGPAYALLLRFARRRLRDDESERSSLAWAGYLNIILASSLTVAIVTAHRFFEGVVGADEFEWRGIAAVVVWTAVWAMHWFWLQPAFGLPGDLHLAVGSLTGLVTLLIGVGGLAFAVGDEIYASLVDQLPAGHDSPDVGTWLVAAVLGAVVWAWHWLRSYLRAERTPLWHVYVLPVATLGGLVAAIASAATIVYLTAVWYVGNPTLELSSEHFEPVPVAAGFLVAGLAGWGYHRMVLRSGAAVERSEPLRAYDYLMAASGLVAEVVGATLALAALFEWIAARITEETVEVANLLILAGILAGIGLPIWRRSWARIGRHLEFEPAAEVGSLTRRLYLVVLFGVGGLTALISLIVVLFVGIDDLLEGTFGGETLDSARVGLALIATVTGVAWYHLGVFRSDRDLAEQLAPPPEPLAPPALLPPPSVHVVLISPRDGGLAAALTAVPGIDVVTWSRGDDVPMPDIDVDALIARIFEDAGRDVAVVVGPSGAEVIPYVA